MINVGDVKYSVSAVATSETGWFRELKELEKWCKENIENCIIARPKPHERVFIFDSEEDAMAFKLTWQ